MLMHLLLVPHAACEHGDLIEVGASVPATKATNATARAAPSRAEARESGSPQDRVDAADGKASGHDHCDVLGVRHRPTDVAPAIDGPTVVSLEPGVSLSAGGEARPVPLLALAPKSSPPAG